MEDLLKLAFKIVAAEEVALSMKYPEIPPSPPTFAPPPPTFPRKKSIIRWTDDVPIPSVIIDDSEPGYLKEFMVKVNTDDFILIMNVDGETVYNHSFSDFQKISEQVDEVDAFVTTDGKYVVHLNDIRYNKSLMIEVRPKTIVSPAYRIEESYWKIEKVV